MLGLDKKAIEVRAEKAKRLQVARHLVDDDDDDTAEDSARKEPKQRSVTDKEREAGSSSFDAARAKGEDGTNIPL